MLSGYLPQQLEPHLQSLQSHFSHLQSLHSQALHLQSVHLHSTHLQFGFDVFAWFEVPDTNDDAISEARISLIIFFSCFGQCELTGKGAK